MVPDGVNDVTTRWIFAWKVDKDGNEVKPKARLASTRIKPIGMMIGVQYQ